MMPMTPTTTTHARFRSKRAPVAELATRSPMSTNPPIADRTPSITPRIFFTAASRQLVLEGPQRLGVSGERSGDLVEAGELAAASGDAHVGDVRGRVVEDRDQLLAEVVQRRVRRLDRLEVALRR